MLNTTADSIQYIKSGALDGTPNAPYLIENL